MKKTVLLISILMLIFGSANAAMYSCVDESGGKTLRNYPCETNEKQQAIKQELAPSFSKINSTGERQNYRGTLEQYERAKALVEEEQRQEAEEQRQRALTEEKQHRLDDIANAERVKENEKSRRKNINELAECGRTGLCEPQNVQLLMRILSGDEITLALGSPHHEQLVGSAVYRYYVFGGHQYQIVFPYGIYDGFKSDINVY